MPSPLVPDRAPAETQPGPEKPPTIPTEDAESFWSEGEDARLEAGTLPHLDTQAAPATGAPFCCVGVDMPGLGRLHGPDCIQRGRPYVTGEVPPSLRAFLDGDSLHLEISAKEFEDIRQFELRDSKRERLLCQLMFAAKDLATAQIEPMDGDEPAFCTECVAEARVGDAIAHEEPCRTGRVLGILRELAATLPDFNPDGKEAVPDGETGRAGDGIRLRGVHLMEAARSLRQAALEETVSLPGRLTWQCNVCGSSVTGLDKTERDIVHGCDCWVGNALVVLSSDDIEGEPQEAVNVVRLQPIDLLCMKCGERGGTWEQGPAISHKGWTLEPNQRVAVDAAATGRYIWTHRCEKGGAQ